MHGGQAQVRAEAVRDARGMVRADAAREARTKVMAMLPGRPGPR
jgi:hypothetical protein